YGVLRAVQPAALRRATPVYTIRCTPFSVCGAGPISPDDVPGPSPLRPPATAACGGRHPAAACETRRPQTLPSSRRLSTPKRDNKYIPRNGGAPALPPVPGDRKSVV